MEQINAPHLYATSFGALPSGTQYSGYKYESKSSVDARSDMLQKLQVGMKAFGSTAGGAGTAGYAMIPVYVDPMIVDQTRKYTPLTEIIPRVTNMGTYADYNVITGKGGAVTAVEDAALSETTTTYDRASTAMKYIYAVGRVTGQAQAAVPPYMLAGFQPAGGSTGAFGDQSAPNALQQEILVKARELKEKEEDLIINGSVSSDATEFDGIVTLMSTTNTVAKGTTALSLDDISLAIQYAFDDGGRPNFAICSSAAYTDLIKLLNAKIGYMQPAEQVFWGFSTVVLNTMVGKVPIIPSMFLSTKSIYFLDLSVVEMRVLLDMTFEKLAKTNDSDKFMLKIYEALIIRNTAFCSSITGLA